MPARRRKTGKPYAVQDFKMASEVLISLPGLKPHDLTANILQNLQRKLRETFGHEWEHQETLSVPSMTYSFLSEDLSLTDRVLRVRFRRI